MANQFQLAGAQERKQVHFAPIFTNRFFQGLWTQRNPLRDAGSTRIEEKFYGTRGDAMISGSNVEISNRLTPVRRPGNSVYNSQSFTAVDYFYEFRLFNTSTEQIKVMVDTTAALYDGTGPSTKSLVFTKSAGSGQTYMQYVANVLFFGNGIDQKKWVQTLLTWTALTALSLNDLETFVIDTNGNIEQLIATRLTTITNVAITSNVLTLTVGSTASIVAGNNYPLWGLTTATFLNGSTINVLTAAGVTVTANFTHGNYVSAADTGVIAVLSGGTPTTGAAQPTWNASSTAPNNITLDGSAVWANRGSPVENWGIVGPTSVDGSTPSAVIGSTSIGWQSGVFYANDFVIIDSNGNLQQVTTAGTSKAGAHPVWATVDGNTTADGTIVWTQLETAAELTWAASHTYTSAKPYLIVNASGTSCLFKLKPNTYPVYKQVAGVFITTNFYKHQNSFQGQCELRNPADGTNNPGVGFYALQSTGSGNSVLFNPIISTASNMNPLQQAVLNQSGDITTTTAPYALTAPPIFTYTMATFGTLTIPAAGQYSFTIFHDDGAFWGVGASAGNQATRVSGPQNCPGPVATLTAVNGYQVMGANNVSGVFQDLYVVNFPVAGDYPFEIDFAKSPNVGQFCALYCNGQTPIPGTQQSGLTQPVWPAWSTAFAPNYPTVQEKNNNGMGSLSGTTWLNVGSGPGPIGWTNIGPATDYAWHASTKFPNLSTILDPNNNTEDAYEAGVTGSTVPTFATGLNQLTHDNPKLIWINQGPGSAPPVGTVTTSIGGWSYTIALVNSLTDTVSNAGPVTAYTGNFIGATGVTISGGLPASIDPQVDYVAIFRTQDGGSNWYLIPGVQNSLYTLTLKQYQANGFLDTTPDSGLNILLQAPLAEENTPPPAGIINLTFHLGRIFGSVGNTVYWSSGPDAPIGNGNEGFPPANVATFPSLVKRIVPTSIGALIFTVSDIYLLGGQATTTSLLFSQPYASGIGLLSYNALAVNGTTIMFFTADSQLVSLDPSSGLSQIGFPIGDQFTLSNWNPANAYVTWHVSGSEDHALYVSDGSTGWFRMTPTASPESGLTWSPFATIVGGCKAVQSVETAPGVHKLLLGPTGTGNILMRDRTTFQDNGTSYTANFTIGSIVLAQPGQIAELAFITTDAVAIGTTPQLSVLIDEVSGVFGSLPRFTADPPQLASPLSLYSQRFYFSQTQSPAICRHMQMRISWPAENSQNEILSITIFGAYMQED